MNSTIQTSSLYQTCVDKKRETETMTVDSDNKRKHDLMRNNFLTDETKDSKGSHRRFSPFARGNHHLNE